MLQDQPYPLSHPLPFPFSPLISSPPSHFYFLPITTYCQHTFENLRQGLASLTLLVESTCPLRHLAREEKKKRTQKMNSINPSRSSSNTLLSLGLTGSSSRQNSFYINSKESPAITWTPFFDEDAAELSCDTITSKNFGEFF